MYVNIVIAIIILILLVCVFLTKPKFNKVILGGDNKKYVISGDIHGVESQYNEFMKYINKGYTGIFLGDFVQGCINNQEPFSDHSKEFYDLLKSKKLYWCCGNHDVFQYYVSKSYSLGKTPRKDVFLEKFSKADDWYKLFTKEQNWFIKCFDEKLIKFKVLMDKNTLEILDENTKNVENVICFSHWVINKITPIKTTDEFYSWLNKIFTDTESYVKIHEDTFNREDELCNRIYYDNYVGHSCLFMLMRSDHIWERLSKENKFTYMVYLYAAFKYMFDQVEEFKNEICPHDISIDMLEEALRKTTFMKLRTEVHDFSNNIVGMYNNKKYYLHLCDPHINFIKIKSALKNVTDEEALRFFSNIPDYSAQIFIL